MGRRGVPLSSLPGFGAPGGLVRAASSLSACPPPAALLRRQASCVSLDRQSSVGAGAARAPFRLVMAEPRARRGAAAGTKPAGDHNRKAGSKAATKQAAPPVGVGSKRAARKAALCSPAARRGGEVFVSETPTRPTTRVGSDSGSNPGSAHRATRSAVLVLESPQLPSRTCASRVG